MRKTARFFPILGDCPPGRLLPIFALVGSTRSRGTPGDKDGENFSYDTWMRRAAAFRLATSRTRAVFGPREGNGRGQRRGGGLCSGAHRRTLDPDDHRSGRDVFDPGDPRRVVPFERKFPGIPTLLPDDRSSGQSVRSGEDLPDVLPTGRCGGDAGKPAYGRDFFLDPHPGRPGVHPAFEFERCLPIASGVSLLRRGHQQPGADVCPAGGERRQYGLRSVHHPGGCSLVEQCDAAAASR